MSTIKQQLLVRDRSVSLALPYWIVPKTNVEPCSSLHPDIEDNILNEEELENMEDETGSTHDFSNVYVIDQVCPRHLLGKKVRVLKLQDKLTNQTALNADTRRPYC